MFYCRRSVKKNLSLDKKMVNVELLLLLYAWLNHGNHPAIQCPYLLRELFFPRQTRKSEGQHGQAFIWSCWGHPWFFLRKSIPKTTIASVTWKHFRKGHLSQRQHVGKRWTEMSYIAGVSPIPAKMAWKANLSLLGSLSFVRSIYPAKSNTIQEGFPVRI